ncbi:PREDICTED: E3 ubiquitin-protein ligase TRAIP [Nanorana parkeri]|uniref:E3 ubiquitin-protein ligase TRAIP n=1 Tax=Nanorana parkeri TaxID=125878 RepID=UPI000854C98B|nr:PREDICTED: E3 ubiquitin-protein ligase TRAIP [Nanorana parkeri]
MPIRALCTICSDYFDHQRDVAAINCGHTFHQHCRSDKFPSMYSRTCPQCRVQVSNRQIIHKLFFDVGLEEESTLDAESLKNEVDRIKASLHIRDKEKRESQDLVDSLREMLDIRNVTIECLERKIGDLEMLCSSLKKQMKFFDLQQTEAKTAKEEARKLRNKLRSLESIEVLLQSRRQEVEEMVRNMGSGPSAVEQLAIYCVSLKNAATHKAQKAEMEVEKMREELSASQKELQNADKEIMSMKKKVEFLQKTLSTPTATNEALSRLIFESPAPIGLERPKLRPPTLGGDINLDLTFDIDTPEPNPPKAVVAPFKKLKLDQGNSPVKRAAKNMLQASKALKSLPGQINVDEEDEPTLPSFIQNSLLRKKLVGSMLPSQRNTGVIRTGFDGLGGRTKFIQPSNMMEIRPLPPKLKKRKVSRPAAAAASSSGTSNQPRLEDFLK